MCIYGSTEFMQGCGFVLKEQLPTLILGGIFFADHVCTVQSYNISVRCFNAFWNNKEITHKGQKQAHDCFDIELRRGAIITVIQVVYNVFNQV